MLTSVLSPLTTHSSVYVFDRSIGNNLTSGDTITLDGSVSEYCSSSTYLYLTEVINPRNTRVIATDGIVEPVILGRPGNNKIINRANLQPPTEQYSELDGGDVFAVPNDVARIQGLNPRLNPNKFGMDFWESLSGELVTIQGAVALGRQANSFGDQWVCVSHYICPS